MLQLFDVPVSRIDSLASPSLDYVPSQGGADKLCELLCVGVSTDPLLAGITGCASDSEGDAKIARERLRACGIATVREFVMCARAQVEGAHRKESALNDSMRSRHGPEGHD